MQSTLQALFRSTIAGVVVQGFRSSSVPVTHEGYLVKSRRPLRFGSSQANLSLSGFNTPALSVGGSVMQHVNNQVSVLLVVPPFPHCSSPCYVSPRSVESGFSMVWSQGSAEYTASPFPEHNCWSCGTGF